MDNERCDKALIDRTLNTKQCMAVKTEHIIDKIFVWPNTASRSRAQRVRQMNFVRHVARIVSRL